MSAPEDRIKALEETVERIKSAWHGMAEERNQLVGENKRLRQLVSDMERRMQALGDKEARMAVEAQPSVVAKGISADEMRKEINDYIAEIDQCLEWLNSI